MDLLFDDGKHLNICLVPALFFPPACNPVEEGHPTTLTCKFHRARCSSLDPLIWLAGRSAAVRCIGSTCESSYGASVSGSVSSTRSKLTLSNVSRSEPFSMETRWTCEPCRGRSLTVCGKMQIYSTCLVGVGNKFSMLLKKIRKKSYNLKTLLSEITIGFVTSKS